MSGRRTAKTATARRRQRARQVLAAIPWPTEAEKIRDQVRRASRLSTEERFRVQEELLGLARSNPKAWAAGRRWHDQQDAIERQRYREAIERYEEKEHGPQAASRRVARRGESA